jgi:hypothetical protein
MEIRDTVKNYEPAVYTIELQPSKMEGLVQALPSLWPDILDEMLAFAQFSEKLDQAQDS